MRRLRELKRAHGPRLRRLAAGLVDTTRAPLRRLTRRFGRTGLDGTLLAVYDLAASPITYDIAWFLIGAELRRRETGLGSIHVLLAPARHGVRPEEPNYETVIDAAARRARIHQLLVPCLSLLPTVSGYTLAGSRKQALQLEAEADARYPTGSSLALAAGLEATFPAIIRSPQPLGFLESPEGPARQVRRWIETVAPDRKVVTVTLRQYGYMPARNSDLASWLTFAHRLDPKRYQVVFIPDTESSLEMTADALAPFPVLHAAAWNVWLRMALYQAAHLNLGINSGPMALCYFGRDTRYVMYKITTESVPQATSELLRSRGLEIGKTPGFCGPFQRWVWEDDTPEVIERAFRTLDGQIEEA